MLVFNVVLMILADTYIMDSRRILTQRKQELQTHLLLKELESLEKTIRQKVLAQSEADRYIAQDDFLQIFDDRGQVRWRVTKTVSDEDIEATRVGIAIYNDTEKQTYLFKIKLQP